MDRTLALVTAAHNEEGFISETVESVIAQEERPQRWIIVNDGSSDRTGEIVQAYARRHSFIDLIESNIRHGHEFGAKVRALNKGIAYLRPSTCAFIGIVDADVSFESSYFRRLLDEFESDSNLGLAGGYIFEGKNQEVHSRSRNAPWSVAGATQILRRECFEAVGGLPSLRYGGRTHI